MGRLTKLGKAKEDVCKPIKVQSVGEPAVDQGGRSREDFGLVILEYWISFTLILRVAAQDNNYIVKITTNDEL